MVKLVSTTLDELTNEIERRKGDISKETVQKVLIGLRDDLPEVHLDIDSIIEMDLYVTKERYKKTLSVNMGTLLELEEYELLSECKDWL